MSPEEVFQFANRAVGLCTDATLFCYGGEDAVLKERYGINRVEAWGRLLQSFNEWYTNRPQDFEAIIELSSRDSKYSEDEFPTLIFTDGAAVLANQLYHTGMLLLLQNKPKFAERATLSASALSTLWHMHRVCGIATNNDRRECWDPCLLASLFMAARAATHRSQHSAIFNTLERVQRLTGWDVTRHTSALKDEWQLAEGW
ncbi:uncharacterized protein BDR25DRAFT_86641 [Lindgomyces ingoldianus]|uniref:Uncharacterized protein n=1 Tax=Lindgomyces ingoldianus TaxID=673940 RepID=A0ACB6QES1_9PLEO|nr:uncharacterized protein BDR25DRAFT_86641 [Lindgomyces ingoldianus]KAF2465386.1 hypothetical protein BDR25DRAFT_86641 [Lindgomyces ingoldianus]